MPPASPLATSLRSVLATAVLVVGLGACTVQDRYEQLRRSNAQECDRLLTQNERDRCKAQLPPASYEEYERQRRSALAGGEAPSVRRSGSTWNARKR